MSDKPHALPSPSPRVCAHEPIIREGFTAGLSIVASAVTALTTLRRLVVLLDNVGSVTFCSDSVGANELRAAVAGLDHALTTSGPAFQRGYDLVTSPAPWVVLDCVAQQVVERDATIQGLNAQVSNLREVTRRAEWAKEKALSAHEAGKRYGDFAGPVHVKASSAVPAPSGETEGVRQWPVYRCIHCSEPILDKLAKAKEYAEFEESRIVAICEVIGAENIELASAKVQEIFSAVVRAFAPGGCGCIDDMPGDNETCSAHRTLIEYARKHQLSPARGLDSTRASKEGNSDEF